MLTIIFPGFSKHNKEWAAETCDNLKRSGITADYQEWLHWKSGKNFSLPRELKRVTEEIGKEKVNILAKSVGVTVALNLVPQIPDQINKVILCGIASVANEDRKVLLKKLVNTVSVDNILCIQNKNDKYVPYSDAKKFYHSVEPNLKVISKPRSDHHYPFTDDFVEFLKK